MRPYFRLKTLYRLTSNLSIFSLTFLVLRPSRPYKQRSSTRMSRMRCDGLRLNVGWVRRQVCLFRFLLSVGCACGSELQFYAHRTICHSPSSYPRRAYHRRLRSRQRTAERHARNVCSCIVIRLSRPLKRDELGYQLSCSTDSEGQSQTVNIT